MTLLFFAIFQFFAFVFLSCASPVSSLGCFNACANRRSCYCYCYCVSWRLLFAYISMLAFLLYFLLKCRLSLYVCVRVCMCVLRFVNLMRLHFFFIILFLSFHSLANSAAIRERPRRRHRTPLPVDAVVIANFILSHRFCLFLLLFFFCFLNLPQLLLLFGFV